MKNALSGAAKAAAEATAGDLLQTNTDGLSAVTLVYLRPLLAEIAQRDVEASALFQGLTLLPGDFDVSGFLVSHQEATIVVRRALQLLADPDQQLGLLIGRSSRVTDRGALALGMLAAPTLAHAMSLAMRYPRSAGLLVGLQSLRSASCNTWHATPLADSRDLAPFLVDLTFASIVHQCRKLSDPNFAPIVVELMRPRPADPQAYEAHFRCPVHFGFQLDRLVADSSWFDPPLPMANTMAYRLSCDLLARETGHALPLPGMGLAVERAIRRAWPRVAAPIDVAASLFLSERSLRRRLADEGLSFRQLLDESRKSRALELLASGQLLLKVVASETGFADTGTFRRAYKRWTGGSPAELLADLAPVGDPVILLVG